MTILKKQYHQDPPEGGGGADDNKDFKVDGWFPSGKDNSADDLSDTDDDDTDNPTPPAGASGPPAPPAGASGPSGPTGPPAPSADDELKKKLGLLDDQGATGVPAPLDNYKPIAELLGLKHEADKLTDAEFKSLASNAMLPEDEQLRNLVTEFKELKEKNPEADILDVALKISNPYNHALTSMTKEGRYTKYLQDQFNLSPEKAKEEVDRQINTGEFDINAAKLDSALKVEADKLELKRKTERETAINDGIRKKAENRKALAETILNTNSLFDDKILVDNESKLEINEFITSGGLKEQLKDHKVVMKVAFFLKNEQKILEVLQSLGGEKGKQAYLNKLQSSEHKPPGGAGSIVDDGDFNINGWVPGA